VEGGRGGREGGREKGSDGHQTKLDGIAMNQQVKRERGKVKRKEVKGREKSERRGKLRN
jgi:hypothetical protein